jgi:hypothetical protein
MATTDQVLELLKVAVQLRATGSTWAEIGKATDRTEGTCRQWPITHKNEWNELWKELIPSLEDAAAKAAMAALHRQERLAITAESESVRAKCNADVIAFGSKTMTQKQDVTHSGQPVVVRFVEGGEDGEQERSGEGEKPVV